MNKGAVAPVRAAQGPRRQGDHDGTECARGTGELFSLTPAEHKDVVTLAVETCRDDTPIIAGVGYSTRIAVDMVQAAERAGVLVLPKTTKL